MRFGLPLSAGVIMNRLVEQVRLILLPWFVADVVIGNFQVAQNFMMLLFSLITALGVALYPAFSKFSFTQDAEGTRQIYRTAVRYSALLVIPLTVLLITISEPLITTLYATRYPAAPSFFTLLVFPGILSGWGLYTYRVWLISQGDTRGVFIIQSLQAVVSLLSATVGLSAGGITGFLLSLVATQVLTALVTLHYLHRHYGLAWVFPHTLRVLAATSIAAVVTGGVLAVIPSVSTGLRLITSTSLYLTLTLLLAPLLGAITATDVQTLTVMLGNQRVVGRVARFVLGVEATVLAWLTR
jgi:O-antigen/teichoic acid export membrane protein